MSRPRFVVVVVSTLCFHLICLVRPAYGFTGDKHTKLVFQVLGITDTASQQKLKDYLDKFNANGIDDAKALQGDELKKKLQENAPEIAGRLPDDFSSLLHRWFFHWGYNAVDPARAKGAEPFRKKFDKKLDDMLAKGIFTADEIAKLRLAIYDIVKTEWINRNQWMHSQTQSEFGLPHEMSTGLATIVYEIHILADFVSPDETAQDQVEALGNLSVHVGDELLNVGLENLFQRTSKSNDIQKLKQQMKAVLQDPIIKGVDEELRKEDSSFQDIFAACGSIGTKGPDPRRAMRILILLKNNLPQLLLEVYGDRPFKEKGIVITGGSGFGLGTITSFFK